MKDTQDITSASFTEAPEASETTGDRVEETMHKGNRTSDKLRVRRALVVYGFIGVLAGWLTMMINPWLSLSLTVIGFILSCIGVRIPPGPRRNFAITAIIAGLVLMLVFGTFAIILSMV